MQGRTALPVRGGYYVASGLFQRSSSNSSGFYCDDFAGEIVRLKISNGTVEKSETISRSATSWSICGVAVRILHHR